MTVVIDWVHQQIHEGKHFELSVHDAEVDTNATVIIAFKTPLSKVMHFRFTAKGTDEGQVELIRAPTWTTGTAVQTDAFNSNENSSAVTAALEDSTSSWVAGNVGVNPTGVSGGTVLFHDHFGSGKNAGSAEHDDEHMLRKDTLYAIVLTSLTENNNCTLSASWYE